MGKTGKSPRKGQFGYRETVQRTCPKCKHVTTLYKNWSGSAPRGGIACPKCGGNVRIG
jgi:ribosomal protein S27E